MNDMEISPNEARHTSNVPLSLETDHHHLNLLHDLRDLSLELRENPFIVPSKSIVELKGVQIRPPTKDEPASYMRLKVTSSDSEPASALISLTGSQLQAKDQRTYFHRPSFNIWEEWAPGVSDPLSLMSTTALVGVLEPQLPPRALESMMDTNPSGIDVAHLLAVYLQKKARTRTEYTRYEAHGIEVGGAEYTRDTDFIIQRVNNRVVHNLFVAASFGLYDFGDVRKTYRYETVDMNGYLESTSASLSVSAGSNVPKSRLTAFAQRDSIRNDPSYGVTVGVNDIRSVYSQSRAA